MSGESWLGYNVRERRKVAFWGLDPVQTAETKRWADTIPGLDDMLFCSMPPVQSSERWDAEARQLANLGVSYVVIDNLTRLIPPGKSVREDEAVNPVLANIDVLINYHDMGVLLIHHSGKPGEDGNPRKTPLGCTPIEAWGRHFLRVEVEHTKAGETNRTLFSYGNSLSMAELKIPFQVVDKGIAIDEARDFDVVNKRMAFILKTSPGSPRSP
jgi:hypothetical protein